MWKAAWGPDRNRVICVLAAQAAYGYSATEALDCPYWAGAPCSGHGIGAIAIAPYFGDRNLPSQWVTQPDGGLARLFGSLAAGGDPGVPDGGWFHETAQWETSYAAIAAHYHLPLIGYEGGQGFISGSHDPAARLLVAANRDPRMGAAYTQYLQQWKGNGGELLVLYNDIGSFSQYGEWGALESLMQWKTSAGGRRRSGPPSRASSAARPAGGRNARSDGLAASSYRNLLKPRTRIGGRKSRATAAARWRAVSLNSPSRRSRKRVECSPLISSGGRPLLK